MKSVEEQLEISRLLQDPEYVEPLNFLVEGFSNGNISSLVTAGRLYVEGTDSTEPSKSARRYENYRVDIDMPNRGVCGIGIDPLTIGPGFMASIRMESSENPHVQGGLYEGLVNRLTTPDISATGIIDVHGLFNARGAIKELVLNKSKEEYDDVVSRAAKHGILVSSFRKSNGFVFVLTETFYLSNDFVDPLNTRKPFINQLEIIHTVKLSEEKDERGEAFNTPNWTIASQAKFFRVEKDRVDLDDKNFIQTLRDKSKDGTLSEYVSDIETVVTGTGSTLGIIGRVFDPKIILSYTLDRGFHLNENLEVTRETAEELFTYPHGELKEKLLDMLGDIAPEECRLTIEDGGIRLQTFDSSLSVYVATQTLSDLTKGFYVIIKSPVEVK